MGKLWSRLLQRHDSDSSSSESDDSTDLESDQNYVNVNENSNTSKKKRVKKDEPTDGWEEICGIAIDVLEDVMLTQKHKIRHSDKYINVKDIKVPSMEENRERLSNAYNLWLKYRPDDSLVFMPKWERILEKPILEQSVLVDEYVRKVYYLLKLEEVPEYKIPDDIPKEEVFIRDPNRPGAFIKLGEALEQTKQQPKDLDRDSCKEIFFSIPTSSHHIDDESKKNLKLMNRNKNHTI